MYYIIHSADRNISLGIAERQNDLLNMKAKCKWKTSCKEEEDEEGGERAREEDDAAFAY